MVNKCSFKLFPAIITLVILIGFGSAFAQAPVIQPPNILYPTPQVYKTENPIAALTPTNTGGAVAENLYGITTFAGSTGSGGTFQAINAIKPDGLGNLYVTDVTQRVFKITPDGVLTVLAGQANTSGNTNGPAANALFNTPGQVATDALGNIYVADFNNNMIRKITSAGVVSTFAGTGAFGSKDGPGASATFYHPFGLVFDGAGNLYVSDTDNDLIRKITPNGTVSTFAGIAGSPGFTNGPGTSAQFSQPRFLTIDAAGNIYVSDFNNNAIREISLTGAVSTFAGTGIPGYNNGAANQATFNKPMGITIDPWGDIFVVDQGNYVVRKITAGGTVSTFAGSGVKGAKNGYLLTAEFVRPIDIAYDPSGVLFLADGSQVRKIVPSGYTIDKTLPPGLSFDQTNGVISGTPTAAWPPTNYVITAYNLSGSSAFTINITVNTGTAPAILPPQINYVTPQVYRVKQTITPLVPTNNGGPIPTTVYGQVSTFAGSGAPGAADGVGKLATFSYPVAIAISPSGNFYVTETVNSLVRQITPQASVTTFAGKAGKAGYADGQGTAALFDSPNGVSVDANGNIYVADVVNNRIRKITPGGLVSTFAGTGAAGSDNGPALMASFNNPTGLAFDAYGNLFVVDQKNNLIREISPLGAVTTFAGTGALGHNDGSTLQATFNQPQGIVIDPSGNIYVTDQDYIRKITSGIVSTFAGSGAQGRTDGPGNMASFDRPYGLAVDVSGNIYVADSGNDLIREVTPQGQVSTIAGDVPGAGPNEKNFHQPTGIVLDAAGNAFITEFWGGLSANGGNIITKLILTGYTIDKPLPPGLTFDPQTGTISGTPTAVSPATFYTITAHNAGGSNSFTINITVKTNVITPQTITFAPIPTKTYGDADFDPGATSDNTTIPIVYQSDNTGVATIVNSMIHITGAGSANITATQAGNDDYSQATPVVQPFIVNQASLVISADDKSKYQGDVNPELTASYFGFVYNEDKSVLTSLPTLSTTAMTKSPVGQYSIAVSGGSAANYLITPLPGILTVSPSPLSIQVPNAFTPNGDGVNDLWNISSLEAFPQCLVSVYSRGGALVFQSRGYAKPWDGTYNGTPLPIGAYYYIIDTQSHFKSLTGYVTILR